MNEENKQVMYVPVEEILPNRFQPRLAFDENDLNNLANSIIKYGVIQPIVVRQMGEKFEIVAGERRYKASVLAGLKKVPAVLIATDDNTSAEIALLENIQRKNLSAIEEAQAYKKLIEKGFTQEDIATKIGISQSSVANKIRLLNLPEEVQNALLLNQISERHARSLLTLGNADLQKSLLKRIISEKLTVKQTEDEIAMLLSVNKIPESIPEEIRNFLKPQEEGSTTNESQNNIEEEKEEKKEMNEVEEFLDLKVPDVINIVEPTEQIEYTESSIPVNPFQEDEEAIKAIEEKKKQDEIALEKPAEPVTGKLTGMVIPEEEKEKEPEVPQKSLKEQLEEAQLVSSKPIHDNASDEFGAIERIEPKLENDDEVEEEKVPVDAEFFNEYGEIQLPRIINKVREFATGLGAASEYIEVSEIDKADSYQITIDIIKN